MARYLVPDILEPHLKVVFCGSRPGVESARAKAFYAHPGNKFWRTLKEVGLTPEIISPTEFTRVIEFRLGLTDITKVSAGQDSDWRPTTAEIIELRKKIEKYKPKVLAFTSKAAGRVFLGSVSHFGRQEKKVGDTDIFVLPSTSGLACRSWDVRQWQSLADYVSNS